MSTTWTETASDICIDALGHVGVYAPGETPKAQNMQTALRGLDAVLKELPLYGYNWPALSGDVALTWSALAPQTISLPSDYFNYPVVRITVGTTTKPIDQIPHASWVLMENRTTTATSPTHFYISPDKTLYFWPIPTANPSATLQYQKIVDDSSLTASPNLPQFWVNPLGYGVANEISLKFGLDQATRMEIAQRWQGKRDRALKNSEQYEPISVTVDDNVSFRCV